MRREKFDGGKLKKKGQMTLPVNFIGWIIVIAVFVAGLFVLLSLWFGFHTLPKEPVEKRTACDLGYMISLWDKATIYPEVFNKSFLQSWDEAKTANSIFENITENLFIPDSDYFVYISDGEKVHSLYVPLESKSVFNTCSQLYILPSEKKKLESSNLLEVLPNGGDINVITEYGSGEENIDEYRRRFSHYNELYAICPMTTFVADPNTGKTSVESMVAGLTTNLATRLRDGIYRVGVKGEKSVSYSLGYYPEGCIVNEGAVEIKQKESTNKLMQNPIIFGLMISTPLGPLINLIFGGQKLANWITVKGFHANCGFNWYWNNTTRVLGVVPVRNGEECKILTKIPKKIVDENNLSQKICKPKKVNVGLWWLNGNILHRGRTLFFLKVEDAKKSWNAKNKVDFCKRRCKTGAPWYINSDQCEKYCVSKVEGKQCVNIYCSFAKSQMHLFDNIPEGAIDIKYVVVDEDKMRGRSFEDMKESEYDSYSVCATWPGVSKCSAASDCPGSLCIDYGEGGVCGSCTGFDGNAFCSPSYLNNPPHTEDYLYSCQSVVDLSGSSEEHRSKCLPVVVINRTFRGKEVDTIDCSKYKNAEAVWKINLSGLCCERWTMKREGGKEKRICEKTARFCPKMKFWPNINSSNVVVLSEELQQNNFFFEIKQKVCRNGAPYNNAPYAFIVVDFSADKENLKYGAKYSEIALLPRVEEKEVVKKCEIVDTLEEKSLSGGRCFAKVRAISGDLKVVEVSYGGKPCTDLFQKYIHNGKSKLYCTGRCQISYNNKKACIDEKIPDQKNSLIIKISEAIENCYYMHYGEDTPVVCAKIDVSKLPSGEKIDKGDIPAFFDSDLKNKLKWKIFGTSGTIKEDSGDVVCIKYGEIYAGKFGVEILPGDKCPGEIYRPPSKGEPNCKYITNKIQVLVSGDCELKVKRSSGWFGLKDELYVYEIKYKGKKCGITNEEVGKGEHTYCGNKCKIENTAKDNPEGEGKEVCLVDIS